MPIQRPETLDEHATGKVTVRSAGSQTRGEIPEIVTTAMDEVGIALTQAYPKPLTDEVVNAAEYATCSPNSSTRRCCTPNGHLASNHHS